MLIQSQITLTWYPGNSGDTADPLVLLDTSHYVEGPETLTGVSEQLVQRADLVRAGSADWYARGNVATTLEWTEVRSVADPMVAQETALALLAGLPTVRGWLLLELATRDTTWQAERAVVRSAGYEHDDVRKHLRLRWAVDCGALSIYTEGATPPTVYPDGEITLEEATPTDRVALLLEDAS